MTQLDSITETLGHREFEVFKLDPMTSLAALNIIKDALASAIGSALGSLESIKDAAKLLDDKKIGGELGNAIGQLLLDITMDRQRYLIDTFTPVTEVDGQKLAGGHFDLVFRGDLPLLFSWLKLCITGEWGNVLGAIQSGISAAIAQTSPPAKSQNISETNGQSSTSASSARGPTTERSGSSGISPKS